jgi:diguanylate cyclase (GGDEF)-like protein
LTSDPSKLLVVDDDTSNRAMLSRRLARHGYAVEVAGSGPQALEKINQAHYDLVLLDQLMPGMSGLDLLRLLRATYSPRELPVIMVTSAGQSQSAIEALNQGANDYVVKPVDLPLIASRIQVQLARSLRERHISPAPPLDLLSNRGSFLQHLSEAITRWHKNPVGHLAVMLLDLDGFKILNDSFGHHAGDQLLAEVAARLKEAVTGLPCGSATLAHIGGDEFAALVEPCQNREHLEAAAKALLDSLSQPFTIQGSRISVSASMGVALSPCPGRATAELLRDADLAMYRAKELGKNRFEWFEPALHERARSRMTLGLDLREAIVRDQLAVFYQPKIQLSTRKVIGFEALLRWRHPERDLISPVEFIPIAEETGLIVPIGEWILHRACAQLKRWQTRFPSDPPLTMNVNLSGRQLSDPDLVRRVERVLNETRIPPHTLKLELTESSLVTHLESAREVLARLQALRVGLKLDDFGIGYSSLNYLRTLHFDSLKIDRCFIQRLASDPDSHAIVETILSLARTLRMNVVAEGIEDEAQLDRLIQLGCDAGQGFLFSRPVTAEVAEKFLESSIAA